MAIKMIMLDLDGTLLDSNKLISEENYRTLARAAAAGVHIIPSTGRFLSSMPQVVRDLPFVRYVSTVNGAELHDLETGEVLFRHLIPLNRTLDFLELTEEFEVLRDFFQDDWGWISHGDMNRLEQFIPEETIRQLFRDVCTPVDSLAEALRHRGRDVMKIELLTTDEALRSQLYPLLREAFPDLNLTSSLPYNMELTAGNASKGVALETFCARMGILPEETLAFGDSTNDLSMLLAAGIGVAMENADPLLKAQADHITATNDENGVSQAIRLFLPEIW